MEKIKGMIVAPFTPFHEDRSLNTKPLKRYVSMCTKHGISGVFINGSTGEGFLLTDKERLILTEEWLSVSPKAFKVIVHCASTCLESAKLYAKHAQDAGAWGIGAMAPPFPKINRIEELVAYCEAIATAAPNLPFYYYHIPAFNGVTLPMLELLQAVEHRIPNFSGIKYTCESIMEYEWCRHYANGKFDMLHGQDETLLASLAMGGATGCIGGTFNYAADLYTGIRSAFETGDIEKARQLQYQSQQMIAVLVKYRGNIVCGKEIMKLIGLDLGPNRIPFRTIEPDESKVIKKMLEEIEFFEYCNQS